MTVTLHGYSYSVYLRMARMTMLEKGVAWKHIEIDPFADEIPLDYLALNPFGRVPTLDHDGFVLYETTAITRYIDESFDGPSLQPEAPRERARMNQIIAIADSYGYWPMVRQVFSERVFNARRRTPDEAVIAEGLSRSRKALAALEALTSDGDFLVGGRLSLADLHLGAMVAYFTAAGDGAAALGEYPKLSAWWAVFKNRKSLAKTEPGLPDD
jgi:glutathione S-transferase